MSTNAEIIVAADKALRDGFYTGFSAKEYPWCMIQEVGDDDDEDNAPLRSDGDSDNSDNSDDDKKKKEKSPDVPPAAAATAASSQQPQKKKYRVHFAFPVIVSGMGCRAPAPVGSVNVEITMPGGECGMISAGGGGDYDSDDDFGGKNKKGGADLAKAWAEYKLRTAKIVDIVVPALRSSNYLGFDPVRAIESGDLRDDQLFISPAQDDDGGDSDDDADKKKSGKKTSTTKFDVTISGRHTRGYGTYDTQSKTWDNLRHRHCRPEKISEKVVYRGPNTFYL